MQEEWVFQFPSGRCEEDEKERGRGRVVVLITRSRLVGVKQKMALQSSSRYETSDWGDHVMDGG